MSSGYEVNRVALCTPIRFARFGPGRSARHEADTTEDLLVWYDLQKVKQALHWAMLTQPLSPDSACHSSRGQIVSALLVGFTVSIAIALEAVWPSLAFGWKSLLLLPPLACLVAYLGFFVRDLRQADELQLRIQLEAAAVGCLGTFGLMLVYPAFESAGFAPHLKPVYVILIMSVLAGAGYINAARRYR